MKRLNKTLFLRAIVSIFLAIMANLNTFVLFSYAKTFSSSAHNKSVAQIKPLANTAKVSTKQNRNGSPVECMSQGVQSLEVNFKVSSLSITSKVIKHLTVDINNDNYTDLIILSDKGLVVFPGNQNGIFSKPKFISSDAYSDILSGDLNNDDLHDIVCVGDDSLQLFLNSGDFNFLENKTLNTDTPIKRVLIDDFNNDLFNDLIVFSDHKSGLLFLNSKKENLFLDQKELAFKSNCLNTVSSDFNGDGNLDFAVVSNDSDDVWICYGDGKGTFAKEKSLSVFSPKNILNVDFNNDNKADLIISSNDKDQKNNKILLFFSEGDNFSSPISFPVPSSSSSLKVGYLNGDCYLDILSINSNNTFSVIRNSGNNTFLPSVEFNLPSTSKSVSIQDLNGDFRDDILFSFEDKIQINLQSNLQADSEGVSGISKPICKGGRPSCDKDGYILNCLSNNVGCDKNGNPVCYEFKDGIPIENGAPQCEIKPTLALTNRVSASLKYRIDANAPYCLNAGAVCPNGMDFICPDDSIVICSTTDNMSEPLCFNAFTGMLSFGMCDSIANPQLYRCVDGVAGCIGGGGFTCDDGFPICSTMNNDSEPICFTLAGGRLSRGSCTSSGLVCFPDQKACNGVCIANSACCNDSDCSGGRVCQSGVCGCFPTHKLCNDVCILNASCCNDPNDCTSGQVCSGLAGSCNCPSGQKLCNGSCIPVDSCCNAPNSCTSGQVCSGLAGSCNCLSGQRLCNGSCLPMHDGVFCQDLNSIDDDECSNRCRCEDAILKPEVLPFTYDYNQKNAIYSPVNNKYYIFNYNLISEYDPDLKTFTPISNTTGSSFDLHNGVYNTDQNKIYFVGATDRNVFVFDPVTKSISMITVNGGNASFVNYDFCSVYHEKNKSIFSLGGITGSFPTNLNYEYLVTNNVLVDKVAGNQDSLPIPLVRPNCVYNPLNQTIVIFGGYKDVYFTQPNKSIFVYNPNYNIDNPLPKFSEQRDIIPSEVSAGVYNRSSNRVQIYLKNGSILEYNPVTNLLITKTLSLPLSNINSNIGTAINSNQNRVLFFGGGTNKIIQHRNSCNDSLGNICPSDKKLCNGSCIPLSNCCNFPNSCTSGRFCLGPSCVCPDGQKLCGDSCIASSACCGNSDCSSGKLCTSGFSASCKCPSDKKVCGAGCVPIDSCCDNPNTCTGGQICSGGICNCPSGQKLCNNSCIPNDNCCDDSQCSSGSVCRGTCVFIPKLFSIEPPVELPGATIKLIGENFLNNITGVSFFTTMVGFNIISNREITLTVPPQSGSQSANVSISGPNVSVNNNSLHFTYLGLPFISSISPNNAQIGDKIKLFGSNFIKTSSVKFNNTSSTFMINAFNEIEADVPSGAGAVNISVTNPIGTSNLAPFTYIPKPILNSLSKTSGIVGETISINGSNFIMVSNVKFQDVQAMFNVVSESKIDVEVPPVGQSSASVTVITPSGTSDYPLNFVYRIPQITSITPSVDVLPGTMININGYNFTNATSVKISAIDAAYSVVNDSSISVTIPSGVQGILFAQVTTPSGSSNTSQISVLGPPSISGISPLKSHIGSTVSISGANLKSATGVMFGDVSATFSAPSASSPDTSLLVTVPPGSGMVQVSITNPVGTSIDNAYSTFTYPGFPVLTSLSPSAGYKDDIISIMGSEFYGAISVMFGDILPAQVVPVSDVQVNIKIPSGSGQKDILVQSPAGVSNVLQFIYDNPLAHACLINSSGFITSNGGCKQISINRAWDIKHPRLLNYLDANDYCENRVINGFDDWRLPTREEIQSLSAYPGQVPPASLAFNFPTNNIHFWTTSMYLTSQSIVQFNPSYHEGGTDTSSLNNTICVRATCNPDQRICGNQCISKSSCCPSDSLNACTSGKTCNLTTSTCVCTNGTFLCPDRDTCVNSSGCCTDVHCSGSTPACNISNNSCVQCTSLNTSSCTSGRVCDLNSNSSNLNKCVCPSGQDFCSVSNSCINSSGCCTDANCTSGKVCVSNSCSCPSGKRFCTVTNNCINSSGTGLNSSVCCNNADCFGGGICMNNTCTSGAYCSDSDEGNNSSIKGVTSTSTLSQTDFCTLGSGAVPSCSGLNCKLREYFCNDSSVSSTIYSCDNCQDGMCIGLSFEIMSNPALSPQIIGLNPQTALASGGGTVNIIGNNLGYVTAVSFGGISANILSRTDSEVRVTLPSILSNSNVLNYPVSVRSPASSGQEFVSNELTFSYYLPAPVLTSILPNQIHCNSTNSISIVGNNFYNITNVSFTFDNGQELQAGSFMVESPNLISTSLPTSRPSSCPISAKIKVSNNSGDNDVNSSNALLSFVPIVVSSSGSGGSSSGSPQAYCDNGDIKCPNGYIVKCKTANPNPTCRDSVLLGYNTPGCCGQNSCYGLNTDFAPRCFPSSSSSGSVQGLACPLGNVIPTCYGNVNNVICPAGFMSSCFGDPVKSPSCCNADYCFRVNEINGPECFPPTSTSSTTSSSSGSIILTSSGVVTTSSSSGILSSSGGLQASSSSGSSRSSFCSLGMVLCTDGNPVTCSDGSFTPRCINGYPDCCKLNDARTGLICFSDKLSCPRSVPFMCSSGQLACGNICCNTGCCANDPSLCLENPSCSMVVSSSSGLIPVSSSSGVVDNGRMMTSPLIVTNSCCSDKNIQLLPSVPGFEGFDGDAVYDSINNKVYLIGAGYDSKKIYIYDYIDNNISYSMSGFVSSKSGSSSVYDPNNKKVYVFGGLNAGTSANSTDNSILEYDVVSDTITPVTFRTDINNPSSIRDLNFSHPIRSASVVWDTQRNVAYIFGGLSGNTPLNTIYKFDPSKNDSTKLVQIATLPNPLSYTSVVWDTQRNVAYIFGGFNDNGFTDDILIFNPSSNVVLNHSVKLINNSEHVSAVWDESQNIAYLFIKNRNIGEFDFLSVFNPSVNELLNYSLNEIQQTEFSKNVYLADQQKILNIKKPHGDITALTPCYRTCDIFRTRIETFNLMSAKSTTWVNEKDSFYSFSNDQTFKVSKFSVKNDRLDYIQSNLTNNNPIAVHYDSMTRKIYYLNNNVIAFDPFNNTFTNSTPSKIGSVNVYGASSFYNTDTGNIFLVGGGGDSIVEYNPSLNTYTVRSERLPYSRTDTRSLWDDSSKKAYIIGGYSNRIPEAGDRVSTGFVNEILEYDPITGAINSFQLPLPFNTAFDLYDSEFIIRNSVLYIFRANTPICQFNLNSRQLSVTNTENRLFNFHDSTVNVLFASEIDRLFVEPNQNNHRVIEYGFGQCLNIVNNSSVLTCGQEPTFPIVPVLNACSVGKVMCGGGIQCCTSCCLSNPMECSDSLACIGTSSGCSSNLIQCGNRCCPYGCCRYNSNICSNDPLCRQTSSSSSGGLQTSGSSGFITMSSSGVPSTSSGTASTSSGNSSSSSSSGVSSSSSSSGVLSVSNCKLDDDQFVSVPFGCKQILKNIVWDTSPSSPVTYSQAESYCMNKNVNGITGWKIPNSDQLINVGGLNKAVSHFKFDVGNRFLSYWSSTDYSQDMKNTVSLYDGSFVGGQNTNNSNPVICIKDLSSSGVVATSSSSSGQVQSIRPEIANPELIIKGAPGDILALTGNNFLNVNKVNFGSMVVDVIPSSNFSLNVRVPDGLGQTTISATSNIGTSSSRSFVFLPVIKGVSSTLAGSPVKTDFLRGQPNDIINLHGLGFYAGRSIVKKVRFIDINNTSRDLVIEGVSYGAPFDIVSVRVPSLQNISTGRFIVETDNGISPLSGVRFDFIPLPEIIYLPPYAMAGESVNILGMNFTGAVNVKFNGYPANFILNNDSSITVTVPSIPSADPPIDVVITTPSGSSLLNNNSKFTYSPVVISVNPPVGNTNTEFNISGANFSMSNNCFLNFTSSGNSVMSSPIAIFNNLIISMLQGAGNGELSVICNGSIESNKIPFSFAPEFTSITPSVVSVGDEITIRGNGLENVNRVQYGVLPTFSNIDFMLTLPVSNGESPVCGLNSPGELQSPVCSVGVADCPSRKGVPTCFTGDARPRCKLVIQPVYTAADCPQGFGVSPCMQGDVIYNCQNNHNGSIGDYFPTCATGVMLTCVNGYPLCVIQSPSETLSDEVFCRNNEAKITLNAPLASGVQNVQPVFNGIAYSPLLTFSYLPQITSLSANTGLPGDMITIRGNNLAGFTMVTFTDSTNNPNISLLANATFAGSDLTVTVPSVPETVPERLFDGKNVNILVANSFGTSVRNISSRFTYSSPVISSISPNTNIRPGDVLIIMGSGFNNVNGVNFGTSSTNTFARASDNEIQVNVPVSILGTSVDCSLTSKQNTISNLFNISIARSPIITSVVQTNNSLTIRGSNFSGATSVGFGNSVNGYAILSSFFVSSSGSIINFTLPTSPIVPPNGKVKIITPYGTAYSNEATPSLVSNIPSCNGAVPSCVNSFPLCQNGLSLSCGSGIVYCCNSGATSCYTSISSLGPKCAKYIFNY